MTKIIMFYDNTCPICLTEAQHMHDNHADKITIMSVEDGKHQLQAAGINQVEAMTYLCVQDEAGTIHKGMSAVRLLYKTAGYRFVCVLSLPLIKPLSNLIYPIFARYRYSIPNWLTKLLFGEVAQQSNLSSCDDGVCQLPASDRIKQPTKKVVDKNKLD